jgi:hypothetical protein
VFESGSKVTLVEGTTSYLLNNTASKGGGLYVGITGTRLTVTGSGTRLVVEGNTAKNAGGISIYYSAYVALSSGARVEVKKNVATEDSDDISPGGILLEDAKLEIKGTGTQLLIDNNKANDSGTSRTKTTTSVICFIVIDQQLSSCSFYFKFCIFE